MKPVWKKGIMLAASLLLLTAAIVYLTTAWYTKMVNVAGMEFQAARWDFTANHMVDNLLINVYEYENVAQNRVAPGTAGYIPITLSATESDTDVVYRISVDKSSMSPEFQKRIFFYFIDEKDKSGSRHYLGDSEEYHIDGEIPMGSTATVRINWEWIYEAPEGTPAQEITAWDEFDSLVGQNPSLYVDEMNATITIAGAQSTPQETTGN